MANPEGRSLAAVEVATVATGGSARPAGPVAAPGASPVASAMLTPMPPVTPPATRPVTPLAMSPTAITAVGAAVRPVAAVETVICCVAVVVTVAVVRGRGTFIGDRSGDRGASGCTPRASLGIASLCAALLDVAPESAASCSVYDRHAWSRTQAYRCPRLWLSAADEADVTFSQPQGRGSPSAVTT